VDNEIQNAGASTIASDDSAWGAGAAPNISGGPNVQQTPQTPQPDQQQPAIPTRKFEQPGEFFRSVAHSLAGAMLGAAAGPDPVQYSRDANGALVSTRPASSNGDKLRRIAQSALTGLAAGANAPRRSGAEALSGLAAGAGAELKKQSDDDLLKRKQADEDFEKQQQTLIRKHDIALGNAHLSTIMDHVMQERLDHDPEYQKNKELFEAAKDSNIQTSIMTGEQLKQMYQEDPEQLLTEHRILPMGKRAVTDGKGNQVFDATTGQPIYENLYGAVGGMKDGTVNEVPASFVEDAKKYAKLAEPGITGLESLQADQPMDLNKLIQLHNYIVAGKKMELQGAHTPMTVIGGPDGKTPMLINSVTKEPILDKDGKPLKPNVKNEPAESAATVANKQDKGEVSARDRFIQDREDKRALLKKQADDASSKNTDVFGNTSTLSEKEFNKRYDSFNKSKQYTTLSTLQGSYQQFQQAVKDINSGKPLSGAASVVGLFNAIGISATPLAGKGFRINENTVREHTDARGLDQKALQKLESLETGAVITENQLKDYAGIAAQVYRDSFINAANEQRRQMGYIDVLPRGNNQVVDPMTASLYLRVAGGDRAKAEAALKKSDWIVPQN